MVLQFHPFREIHRAADQAFASNSAPAMPMDAVRRGETVHVFLDLPGVDPASIDLEVERNVLTVKAERRWAREDGDQVLASERRTLVERSIENDLLCGVVQRFQRPVHTLKLKELAKLNDADCNLLDSLMTKYSGFEHSQPTESPIALPNPDDLLAAMTSLKNWREEYAKRSATAVISR